MGLVFNPLGPPFDLTSKSELTEAEADLLYLRLDTTNNPLTDKLAFTQADEYIDSLTSGELDLDATTSINLRIGGTEQLQALNGIFQPTTTNDIDLGTDALRFKDIHTHGIINVADRYLAGNTFVANDAFAGVLGAINFTSDATLSTTYRFYEGVNKAFNLSYVVSSGSATFTSNVSMLFQAVIAGKKVSFDTATTVDFLTGGGTRLQIGSSYVIPGATNTIDLGSSTKRFKDGFFQGNISLYEAAEMRFYDVGSSHYTGFEAPALTGNQIYVLPTADGSANDTLMTDGAGTLSWKTTASEKSWAFSSPTGSSGTFYVGGFYIHVAQDNDFNPSVNLGTANSSYAAHVYFVTASGATDTEITVTGTSITDAGVRQAADTEVVALTNGAADVYYETSKKFIGLVTVNKTAGTDRLCNYGWAKYWDNNNTDFIVSGFEATWFGGATDANADIQLLYHTATGWTYVAGANPATPPAALADLQTDHDTEYSVINNENGAYKRANLNQAVDGDTSEGTIIKIVTGQNKTFELANFIMRITT